MVVHLFWGRYTKSSLTPEKLFLFIQVNNFHLFLQIKHNSQVPDHFSGYCCWDHLSGTGRLVPWQLRSSGILSGNKMCCLLACFAEREAEALVHQGTAVNYLRLTLFPDRFSRRPTWFLDPAREKDGRGGGGGMPCWHPHDTWLK